MRSEATMAAISPSGIGGIDAAFQELISVATCHRAPRFAIASATVSRSPALTSPFVDLALRHAFAT
jgi:hypothetical protein